MSFKLDIVNNNNYKIVNNTYIEELDLRIYELIHNKTRAKIILLENDDENRVFNIAFKTPVNNSKGTPHILEHSVLCGSKKYNVKDPFIELAKSSMNTFLNAMTYPDKTCYPVASANLKDFKNLTDVYLDSVFFPNIYKNKNIFLQEGWHYEYNNEELDVNGVVLNEMRGAYSDKNEILSDLIFKTLYQNTNYAYSFGGDPKEIINLSYEEFLDFHRKFYSPSNAIIYFYGKLDFNERLSYLHNEYLSKFSFDKKQVVDFNDYYDKNKLPLSNNNELKHINGFYNVDKIPEDNNTTILSYNFLIKRNKTTVDHILLRILDYILFNKEGAIIKDELIKNNLGQSIQTIYESALYQPMFCIQSFNINESKKDDFVKFIDNKIKDILDNGIDKDKFEAGYNALCYEFFDTNDNQNKGLNIILNSLDTYLYGEDIALRIQFKKAFDEIKKYNLNDLSCPIYSLIKEIFVDNENKNLVSLSPKVNMLNDYNNELKYIIDNRKESMTKKQFDMTIEETTNLKKYQENPDDDYSCLPKLLLTDIDRDKDLLDYNIATVSNQKLLVTTKSIDDLVFIGLNVKLDDLTDFEIYMLSILIRLLDKVDIIDYDYKQLNDYIDLYTGLFTSQIVSYNDTIYLRFNIKTMIKNLDDSFDLLYKVIFNSLFDDKNRILEILNECKSNASSDITSSGHNVVYHRALFNISKGSRYVDMTSNSGLAFNMFLNELLKIYNDNWKHISNNLKYIAKKIFNIDKFSYDVCLDNKNYDYFEKALSKFIDRLNNTIDASSYKLYEFMDIKPFGRNSNSEAFVTNNDVNFVARAGKFKKENYNGSMQVLATLFNYDYLWNNIRVLGGAYGCFARFNKEGYSGFATYRDPNVVKSDDCFKKSVNYLDTLNNDLVDIDKLIVSSIAKLDNPINIYSAHDRNVAYMNLNLGNDYINKIRHQILDTNLDTIKDIDNQLVDIINTNETCALIAEKSYDEAKNYYKDVIKLDFV